MFINMIYKQKNWEILSINISLSDDINFSTSKLSIIGRKISRRSRLTLEHLTMMKSNLNFSSQSKSNFSSTFFSNSKRLSHSMNLKWDFLILLLNLQSLFIRFLILLNSNKIFDFRSLCKTQLWCMSKRNWSMMFSNSLKNPTEVVIFL